MKEYIYTGTINGQEHRLQVIQPMIGLYKVYWDALYLGNIEPILHDQLGLYWETDSPILQECCQDLGEYIETYNG